MSPSSRGWRHPAVAAAIVAVLLVVVAVGSNGRSWGGGGSRARHLSPEFWNYVSSAFVALWLGAIAWLVYTIVKLSRERDPQKQRKKDWVRIVALFISLLLILAIRLRYPDLLSRLGRSHGTPHGASPGGGQGAQKPHQLPGPARTNFHWESAVGVGVVLLAALGLYLLYRHLTRSDPPPGRHEAVAVALAQALDDSLDDLRREPDPRKAVIAAYARMERTFAAYGMARVPSEAPVEYLRRMLAELDVSGPSARRLTDLYERARFSTHEVDSRMKDDAIDALVALRDELRREPQAA